MNKIIKLARLIKEIGLDSEASRLIRLASNLKRLELAEVSEEPLGEIEPRDIAGTDSWMKWVAHDLSEILGLHAPAFLGSSVRDKFGRGAYAFSASNDAGESVVLKIILTGDVRAYQKIINLFGDDPPSIVPRIYKAGYFNDIGYEPPVKLANDFGYVVMEELEPMPANMAKFLQEPGSGPESFRFLKESPNEMRRIINLSVERIRITLTNHLSAPLLLEGDIDSKVNNYLSLYKETLWNRSGNWMGLDNMERFSDIIYHDFFLELSDILKDKIDDTIIKDMSNRVAAGFLNFVNSPPVEPSYSLDTPLGNNFRSAIKDLEEFGINPMDLHADNIMLRPGTGEIVISDLGQFEFGFM